MSNIAILLLVFGIGYMLGCLAITITCKQCMCDYTVNVHNWLNPFEHCPHCGW